MATRRTIQAKVKKPLRKAQAPVVKAPIQATTPYTTIQTGPNPPKSIEEQRRIENLTPEEFYVRFGTHRPSDIAAGATAEELIASGKSTQLGEDIRAIGGVQPPASNLGTGSLVSRIRTFIPRGLTDVQFFSGQTDTQLEEMAKKVGFDMGGADIRAALTKTPKEADLDIRATLGIDREVTQATLAEQARKRREERLALAARGEIPAPGSAMEQVEQEREQRNQPYSGNPMRDQEYAERKTQAAQEDAAKTQQEQARQEDIRQKKTTPTTTAITEPETAEPPSAFSNFSSDPTTFLDDYLAQSGALKGMYGNVQDALSEMKTEDSISQILYEQGSEQALERKERQIDFNKRLFDIQRSDELAAQSRELAAFEVGQSHAEFLAREQAIDNEKQARRVAARLGVTYDGSGLEWMMDVNRKSNEYLGYVLQSGGLNRAAIIMDHTAKLRKVDYDFQLRYDEAWNEYDKENLSLKKERLLSKTELRKEKKELNQYFYDKLFELDKMKAEKMADLLKETIKMNEEAIEKREKQDEKDLARKDRLEAREDSEYWKASGRYDRKVAEIRGKMQTDKIISGFDIVGGKFSSIESAIADSIVQNELYVKGEIDSVSMNLIDQQLINSINKLWDEQSVIRESEYARTPSTMSLMEGLKAKALSFVQGGVLSPNERQNIQRTMKGLKNGWTGRVNERKQQFYLEMQAYNSSVSEEFSDFIFIPDIFGLDVYTTPDQQSILEKIESEAKPKANTPLSFKSITVGGKIVQGQLQLIAALTKADNDYFRDTGRHISVNQSLRTRQQQEQLYKKYLAGGGRAAPPGKSFHEKGLAIDITNWKESEQYLRRYGLLNKLKDDKGHFSMGEFA